MKARVYSLIFSLVLLLAAPAQTQTWDLITSANSNLQPTEIRGIYGGSGSWLIYVLHPNAISRFNGRWQYFADTTFGQSAQGGENNVLYFDRNGSGLWIGRNQGLFFASNSSLALTPPSADNVTKTYFSETPAPNVYAIYRDNRQTLWIGTGRGLFRYAPQLQWQLTRQSTVLKSLAAPTRITSEVYSIVEAPRSELLLLGTSHGIVLINSAGDSLRSFVADAIQPRTLNLYTSRNGWVWAATPVGLYVAMIPSQLNFTRVCTPPDNKSRNCVPKFITAVTQDYSDAIWAVTSEPARVYRYRNLADPDPLQWKPDVFPCQASDPLPCVTKWPAEITDTAGFNSLSVDRAGFVWLSSPKQGILRYNMLWETINLTEPAVGLPSNFVRTLYWSPIDSSLYVGTNIGAAKRDKNGKWTPIPRPNRCSSVYSFLHDPAGFLLMGISQCGGPNLVGYDGTRSLTLDCAGCRTPTSADSWYNSMVKLPNDTLWLAGQTNLWVTRVDSITQIIRLTSLLSFLGLSSQKFNTFLLQDKKFVWIGTSNSGLIRYNLLTRRVDVRRNFVGKFDSRSVLSLYLDKKDTLWIGTRFGLTRLGPPYDVSPWVHVNNTSDSVNFVFADATGGIWFDAKLGVAHYSREAGITTFPQGEGPANQEVRAGLRLLEKGRESYWFGTEAGVSVFLGDLIPPETTILPPSSPDPSFKFMPPNMVLLPSSTLFVQYEGGDNFSPNNRLSFRTKLMRIKDRDTTFVQQKSFSSDRAEQLFFPESGLYLYEVQARDQSGNLDPKPACLVIDVDIDPPSVVITQPAPLPTGAKPWVSANLVVRGSVLDNDLKSFKVEIINLTTKKIVMDTTRSDTLRNNILATFSVHDFNEDFIRIRVTAIDRLKHIRRDSVEAHVDADLPEFEILEPKDSTQVSVNVPIRYRTKEKYPKELLYVDKSSSTENKGELPIAANDTLFNIIPLDAVLGKHKFKFSFSDQAGNVAEDSLAIFRVKAAIGSASQVRVSQDNLVEVHLPPGLNSVDVLISPAAASYADTARMEKLEPHSRAYVIAPDTVKFGREAVLTFVVHDVPAKPEQLSIFRREEKTWKAIGGRLSTEAARPLLRAGIKRGGIYLAAIGVTERFQPGNLTCLPRLFSPGRYQPSPFTEVVFTLDKPSPVSIQVYNAAGRRLKILVRDGEMMPPGRQPVQWDGRDDDGKILRSGIYIVVVKTPAFTETKTVVIQN